MAPDKHTDITLGIKPVLVVLFIGLFSFIAAGQSKHWALGLNLAFPSKILNGTYIPSSNIGEEPRRFSFGRFDPGINLSFKGFTFNFYWRYQYGGRSDTYPDRLIQFSETGSSYNYSSPKGNYIDLSDPFDMEFDDFYFFNLGYQHSFKSKVKPSAPAPIIGAYIGPNNFEIATGLEYKSWRFLLYAQMLSGRTHQLWFTRHVPFNGYNATNLGVKMQALIL